MTGWLIGLAVIALIAAVPVGATVQYDADGPAVRLIIGPVTILLYPRPQKGKKKKSEKQDKNQKKAEDPVPVGPPEGAPAKKLKKPKEKGGSITDFLPLLDVALDLLAGLKDRLRVNLLRLHLVMAADDPADLAINYGRAQAAGAALLAKLNEWLIIKKQDVQIQCDFTSDETTIAARADLTITVGRIISLAAIYGIRGLKTFLKVKKQREGGA